jgi:hypothetical protein
VVGVGMLAEDSIVPVTVSLTCVGGLSGCTVILGPIIVDEFTSVLFSEVDGEGESIGGISFKVIIMWMR